ncbi:hypothetical protein GGR57DRAFT_231122 [Xylariaceae sp. FL1272]|nr:hypothetical protein GGR57DRAFT_231122 [Xylariaceae sp. FL1272]
MASYRLLLLYLVATTAVSQACTPYDGQRCCGSSTGSVLESPSSSPCPVLPSQHSRRESTHPRKRAADKDDELDIIRHNFTQVMANLNDASSGAISLMMQLVDSLESLSQKASMLEAASSTSTSSSAPSGPPSTLPSGLYSYSFRPGSSFNNSIGNYPTPTSGLGTTPVASDRSASTTANRRPTSSDPNTEDIMTVTVTTTITPVTSDPSLSSSATPGRHPMSSNSTTENTTTVTVTTKSTITITTPAADDIPLATSSDSRMSSSDHHPAPSTTYILSQGHSPTSENGGGAKSNDSTEDAGSKTTLTVHQTVTVLSTTVTTMKTSPASHTSAMANDTSSCPHRPSTTMITHATLQPDFNISSTMLTMRKSDRPPYPSSKSSASLAPAESYPVPPPYFNRSSNATFASSRTSKVLNSTSTSICSEFLTLMSPSPTKSSTVMAVSATGSTITTPSSPNSPSTVTSSTELSMASSSSTASLITATPFMSPSSAVGHYKTWHPSQIVDLTVIPVTSRRSSRITTLTDSDRNTAPI